MWMQNQICLRKPSNVEYEPKPVSSYALPDLPKEPAPD